jgi:YD repeat-containing protein
VNALTGITDEEGVRYATYDYDSEGRAISSEHAGGVDDFSVTYNSDGTVTTTNALGKETTYTFDTILGTKYVVQVEGHASTHCAAANKFYTRDKMGAVERETDWNGNVTEYERDSFGQVTSKTEDVGGSAERTTTTTYDSTFRLPDVITETGKTTDYGYDSDGRMTSMTITDTNTSETRTTTYSY